MRALSFARVLVVAVVCVCSPVAAQQPRPKFDVASVKRSPSQDFGAGRSITYRGDSFRATGASLQMLVSSAYGIPEGRLDGGPNWVGSERFDIEGRAASEVPREQLRAMAQTLLEERFGLVLKQEQREQNVYVLTLARTDGGLGPDLRRAADDCDRTPVDFSRGLPATPKSSSGAMPTFWGTCGTLDSVARQLARSLGTDVLDRTGLAGRWDFVAAYKNLESGLSGFAPPDERDRPSIFAAVEEQLGLKLERAERQPVEFYVIASVHPPTAD